MKQLAGLSALALIIATSSGCGWLWVRMATSVTAAAIT